MIPWIIGVSFILTIVCAGLGFWLITRTSASNSVTETATTTSKEKNTNPWRTAVRVLVALTITSLVLGGVGSCGVLLLGIGEQKARTEVAGAQTLGQNVPVDDQWSRWYEIPPGYNATWVVTKDCVLVQSRYDRTEHDPYESCNGVPSKQGRNGPVTAVRFKTEQKGEVTNVTFLLTKI